MRIGLGYDIHRLVSGRKLLLGGVEIPSALGEEGHSDGDVLIHAVIDALLGAAAQGDIGTHFPPENPEFKDISSRVLLSRVLDLLRERGRRVGNVDTTVVLQSPRLTAHMPSIRKTLAGDIGIEEENVSVKAKTREGIGDVGGGRAVEAYAVVLIE